MIWTTSSLCPHALRQAWIAATYLCEDQATFSEGLTTMAFPVMSAEMIGFIRSVRRSVIKRAEMLPAHSDHVVKGIIPRDDGRHDTDGFVVNMRRLVHHGEQARFALLWFEVSLAVFDCPPQLFARRQDFAEASVEHSIFQLATRLIWTQLGSLVFPESRQDTRAMASMSLTHHSSKLRKTRRRSANEVRFQVC